MRNYKLKIFSDFDGTISKNDIWISSFIKFINDTEKFNEIIYNFTNLYIGAKECSNSLIGLIEDFSFEKFHEYLDREEIDPFFKDFAVFCEANEISLTILSGGFDYYIDYILKRNDLRVEFYSSKLTWQANSAGDIKLGCEFPYDDEHCFWCETSKRNILINNTNDLDNEISVFIGDGISDFCAANYSDYVFAKGRLASYCWKNNITYFDYSNFNDIMNKLKKLLERKNLKHRQEAKIRRRDVFMGG